MRRVFSRMDREPERILVTALCPIGDTLFLTPALARLRQRYPRARIMVVVSASNEGVLDGNPDVDERILTPARGDEPEAVRFARGVLAVSRSQPDLIVNFSAAGAWVVRLAGLRAAAVGLDMPPLWGLVGSLDSAYRQRHAIDHYLKAIEPIAPPPLTLEARTPRLYLSAADRRAARALLIANGVKPGDTLVTMHVGGDGFDGRKRWAPQRFARVANALIARFGARIVLVGGKADLPMSKATAALIHGDVRSLVGKTSLKVTAGIIEASTLFIGNDSSPLHIAAVVNTPSVGIYGPSDWREFHPVGGTQYRGQILHSDLPCAPCFRFVGNAPLWRVNTCYSHACLNAIDSRRVIEAATELLGETLAEDDARARPRPAAVSPAPEPR